MPIHTISDKLSNVDSKVLTTTVAAGIAAYALKVYNGGKKSAWEREWGGKLIIIAAPPEPTTLALIHKLLNLPSPPQILYLPPLASPLPQSLLTVLHAMKLAASGNPLAQLNCEPLPPTPGAVRDFVRKWSTTPYGTTGEGGRRVDALVLGGNWECSLDDVPKAWRPSVDGDDDQVRWTPAQLHFHLITSLLPHLLKAPAERNIRIVQLVSPAWSAALPGVEKSMQGKAPAPERGPLPAAAKRGVSALLCQERLALVLNTLASAAYSKRDVVPDPSAPAPKKRDSSVQSNILALSVIMPWARDEVVRPIWGTGSIVHVILWFLLYPLVLLLTPSPAQSVQSVLFALNAPTAYVNDASAQFSGDTDKSASDNMGGETVDGEQKPKDLSKKDEPLPDNQRSIRQGSVVRDCQTIELPPVLRDEKLARATYDRLEQEVTRGVVESEAQADSKPKAKGAETKPKAKATVEVAGGVPGQQPSGAAKAAVGQLRAEAKAEEVGQQHAAKPSTPVTRSKSAQGQGQKRADEVAAQEHTDPADTVEKAAPAHDAAKQAQSQKRADELKQQHGLDAVKPGESFADALKEGTDEDPHKQPQKAGKPAKASTHTGTHDAHVHKGESFADAIKEHAGQHQLHQEHQQHQQPPAQKPAAKAAPGSTHTGTHDPHVHKGESFADAIKDHATHQQHQQHQAPAQKPAAKGAQGASHAGTHDAHTHKGESFADAIKEHAGAKPHAQQQTQPQPQPQGQGQGHVHAGESFAAALKEHAK